MSFLKNRLLLIICLLSLLAGSSCSFSRKMVAAPSRTEKKLQTDSDNDGIPDDIDQCPETAGTQANKGCPDIKTDTDNDGIPDNNDKCPGQAGPLRNNGCPIPDADHDGISDEQDQCPQEFGVARYGGCPVPDTDKDGVNDEEDKCRIEKGSIDNNGCPETSNTDITVKTATVKAPFKSYKASTPRKKAVQPAIQAPEPEQVALTKDATITYSYPKNLQKGEQGKLVATIVFMQQGGENQMVDKRELHKQKAELSAKNDSSAQKSATLKPYSHFTMIPLFDPAEFAVQLTSGSMNQPLDKVNGNKWEWTVTSKTSSHHSNIRIVASAEDAAGNAYTKDENEIVFAQPEQPQLKAPGFFELHQRSIMAGISVVSLSLVGLALFIKKQQRSPESA